MKILSRFEMEQLTTPRLIAYRNALLRCREEGHSDEWEGMVNKDDDIWQRCYDSCLDILSKREHVKKKHKNKRRSSKCYNKQQQEKNYGKKKNN